MRHLAILSLLLTAPCTLAADGNRLTYLQECNPYYPSRTFPKLITPQWVGKEGVEAVVILAIDDMKGSEKWEKFLRPILNRLKKIDGRAPVSIMTCQVDPKDPHLQKWLKEGVSLECHTFDHPCPFFQGGFKKAKGTYDRCVDLLHEVPGNKPVAFRMPCCDSMNTPSPRFYAEIFNRTTEKGRFLQIDSSVFNVFTPQDRELPRAAVLDEQGRERFRKYLPHDRTFVNYIEDYPYPYVIDRLCWEFPCVTPSDWQAQHLHKPANPLTLRDWKAALDCTVAKQGVFTMVFHPYGWSTPEQHIDLIDYAVTKYGKKVKFLTFREALERLNKMLQEGHPLRHISREDRTPLRNPKTGEDNGVRILDVDNDGFMDVLLGDRSLAHTWLWSPKADKWQYANFPCLYDYSVGILQKDGKASVVSTNSGGAHGCKVYHYTEQAGWVDDPEMEKGIGTALGGAGAAAPIMYDLDGDGRCEMIFSTYWRQLVVGWAAAKNSWAKLPFALPADAFPAIREAGLRFVDIDMDGKLDLIWSNEDSYGLYLFKDMRTGWTKLQAGIAGEKNALPPMAHGDKNMGVWVHSKHLWWSNENTVLLKDHVARRSFAELLQNVQPGPRSPKASLKALHPRPGFVAEQVVCEPLVQSPIAFAWGPDGKLWVVEMGDYPLGTDGKGKPGGRIKFLESTKGDGKYDKMTVFMEGLAFPTGVLPWRKGVLVTCAPEIFYAEDQDGDGRADVKITLYTGFVEGNQQHRVNSLVWGLDNWIYVANGDSGGTIKCVQPLTPGRRPLKGERTRPVNISGRDLRIRPDTGELEAVTGTTQYGRSRDDWGNWFGGNNSNPMWHYVLDDHYIRRNPHFAPPATRIPVSVTPGAARVYPRSRTLPRFNDPGGANHFTSACSPIVYRDELFGPARRVSDKIPKEQAPLGDPPGAPVFAFVSEPVHNLVHREIMTPKGVTFTSRRAPDEAESEFLASEDNWCRPTMIQTGPDGALWVADMYRHVIEHPQWIPLDWQKKLDLRAGHDMGRIYRVYPKDKKTRRIPHLAGLDSEGLVLALESPNGWQRDMAHMLLLWRQDRAAIPLLEKMAVPPRRTDAPNGPKTADPGQRPLARLHALCTLDGLLPAAEKQPASFLAVLRKALADPHPSVRKHAVRVAESRLGMAPELGAGLLKLVDDPDPQVRLQLACTLGEWDDPEAGKALGKIAVRDAGDPYLMAAVMSSISAGNLDDVLLGALETGTPPVVVQNLLRLASAFGKSRALVTLLGRVTAPEKNGFAPWQYAALAGLLDTAGPSISKLVKEGDSELQEALKKVHKVVGMARLKASDPKVAPVERALAIGLLGRGIGDPEEDRNLLAGLLIPQEPDQVQAAAVEMLGKLGEATVPKLLLRGWKGHAPTLRSQVLDVLLRRDDWAGAVLGAIEKKQVLPFEVDAARRQRLLDHKNTDLRRRAAKLFAAASGSDRQKVIDDYKAVLTLKGEPARGKVLFTKHCAACHKLAGIGNDVGPELVSVADKSNAALLIAVLDPNRAVEARYINYAATTKSGLTLTGVLTSQTGNSITLVGVDGKAQVVLRTDLEELVSTGRSAMPEGLEKDLRPQDLADLFEFLREATAKKTSRELFNHPADQDAQLLLGGVGHGDDLLQVGRLQCVGQAQVGDYRQAQVAQPGVDADNHLRYRGHAHHVGADAAQETILGSRFQVWSRHRHEDAPVTGDAFL
jgi:putative membrane-bound dehydrogenase-like protein